MYKLVIILGKDNLMCLDNDDYMFKGYVLMESQYDNLVFYVLEYYVVDYVFFILVEVLGKKEDVKLFCKCFMGYKNYYSKDFGILCLIIKEGKFYELFDLKEGVNFVFSFGFYEGNVWNYIFFVFYDINGLVKLMGGDKKFVDKL